MCYRTLVSAHFFQSLTRGTRFGQVFPIQQWHVRERAPIGGVSRASTEGVAREARRTCAYIDAWFILCKCAG